MFYLIVAILCSLIMTFVMKYSESHSGNRYGVTLFNYITGALIGYLQMNDRQLFIKSSEGFFTLGMAALQAIFIVSVLLVLQASINKNGAPLTSTFNRMGILIPTIGSAILFGEIPSWIQIVGIGLAIFAIIYISGGAKKESASEALAAANSVGTGSERHMILLFSAFIGGGCLDFISKLFDEFGEDSYKERFVFYGFVISSLMALVLCLVKNRNITWKDMLMGVMLGVPNQLNILFLLKAVGELPAYLVYPCYSAGVILAVNVVNVIVFREVLSKREYIATGIIALGLIFINI